MKKRIFMLLCLAAMLQTGWAQKGAVNTDRQVENIRQRYTEMKKYVATHTGHDLNDGADFGEYYHLEARQWLPGTGGHIEDTYLFWGEVEGDAEEIYPRHYVQFVTKKFNYAARNYYQEFLYDADGHVAFIYAYDPMLELEGDANDKQYEFRFYFNKGHLLKAIVKSKSYDQQEFRQVWSGTTLKPVYQSNYDEYINAARTMRELFINIEKEAYM